MRIITLVSFNFTAKHYRSIRILEPQPVGQAEYANGKLLKIINNCNLLYIVM